jgi:hypothetical protein
MGEPRQVEAGPSTPTLPGGFEKWRTNLSQFTGLGLTDEQKAERELSRENQTLAKDWDRCEKWKKELLERSTSPAPNINHYRGLWLNVDLLGFLQRSHHLIIGV